MFLFCTPLAPRFAESVDDSARAALQRDVCEAWKPFVNGDGMRFDVGITTLVCR